MYRRTGRSRFILLALLALSGGLITLDFRSGWVLDPVRDTSQAALAPVQEGLSAAVRPLRNLVATIGDLGRLRERNRELETEVARLSSAARQTGALIEENNELRAHLGLAHSWRSAERVTAQVIADAPGNYRWSVVIDRGAADGVRSDMPVLAPDGLVGRVIRADAHRATVLLLVDPTAGAAAEVEGKPSSGVVAGNGAGRPLSFELVDKDAGVVVGDHVVTSNLDRGLYPAGVPVGTVASVAGDERAASFEIEVEPFVDFLSLDFVEVLLIPAPPLEGVATP